MGAGWAFCPTERQLTDLYLHRKINDVPLPGDTGSFIHVADVYSAEPEKLVERLHRAPGTGKGDVHKMPVWYFFSPVRYVGGRKTNARGEPGRKSRTIKGAAGTGKHWHSEKGERPVKGGSDYGGHEQYFSYKVKNPSSGKDERGGWIMWEYSISPDHGGGDLVLCKIYPRQFQIPSSTPTRERHRPAATPRILRRARRGDSRTNTQCSWKALSPT
ncbi:hypothetical protein ACQ4PT_034862 [Festuca glaucescens]